MSVIIATIGLVGLAAGYGAVRLLRPRTGDQARWLYRRSVRWVRYSLALLLVLLGAAAGTVISELDISFVRSLFG